MTGHAVVIAGGGPTGLMLAAELALAGVDVAIVERRANQDARRLARRRAARPHHRGARSAWRSPSGSCRRGRSMQVAGFAGDPARHQRLSDAPQLRARAVAEPHRAHPGRVGRRAAVPIHRGREVTGFAQDDTGVDVALVRRRARCARSTSSDATAGAASSARRPASTSPGGTDDQLPDRRGRDGRGAGVGHPPQGRSGIHGFGKLEDGARVRVDGDRAAGRQRPTSRRCATSARRSSRVYGTDFGVHSPRGSRGSPTRPGRPRPTATGRVLLAGDAAHVHYPAGGQGLNIGVQDAVNLGWKLAQVVERTSPDEPARHVPGRAAPDRRARAARHDGAGRAVPRRRADARRCSETVAELLAMDEPRKRYAGMMSGLDVHYDLGAGHPLLGRRMPDLELVTADGPRRVFTLLHDARPVLLNLGEPGGLDIAPWADRVQRVDAELRGRVGAARCSARSRLPRPC